MKIECRTLSALFLIFLVACNPSQDTYAPQEMTTSQEVSTALTSTATFIPTSTHTITFEPSPTSRPTKTLAPSPTITPTLIPEEDNSIPPALDRKDAESFLFWLAYTLANGKASDFEVIMDDDIEYGTGMAGGRTSISKSEFLSMLDERLENKPICEGYYGSNSFTVWTSNWIPNWVYGSFIPSDVLTMTFSFREDGLTLVSAYFTPAPAVMEVIDAQRCPEVPVIGGTQLAKPEEFDKLMGIWEGVAEGAITFVGPYTGYVRAEIVKSEAGNLFARITIGDNEPVEVYPSTFYPNSIDQDGYFCFAKLTPEGYGFVDYCFRPINVDSVDYYMMGPSFGEEGILSRINP
jgi:hypothetical protein